MNLFFWEPWKCVERFEFNELDDAVDDREKHDKVKRYKDDFIKLAFGK